MPTADAFQAESPADPDPPHAARVQAEAGRHLGLHLPCECNPHAAAKQEDSDTCKGWIAALTGSRAGIRF